MLLVLGAAIVLAGVAGAWIFASRDGERESSPATGSLLTADELRVRAASAEAPVYWVGPREGHRYVLEVRTDGASFVRYVPPQTVENASAARLVVATYPAADALADVRAAGRRPNATALRLPNGGVAALDGERPSNVFVAFPGVAAQIEVFDPRPDAARAAVARGAVRPVTPDTAGQAEPFAASAGELRRLARSLRPAPVYWAGWKQGARYEVTLAKGGTVYVRYLPTRVEAGDPRGGLLTIATYPRSEALDDIEAAAKRAGAVSFPVPANGLAVFDRASPTNVHLAYPNEPWQIEVHGADAATVAALVRAGKIVRVP